MAMPKNQLEAKLKEEHDLINQGVLREENPLDLSEDFAAFLEACRKGDLKQCQNLISAGVNINGKDEFDYTPLIIASLCGHYEVAQLLLESGALAERNTFQGERCLYNALNDRIRNLLLQYDYSKSSDPLQPWASHITSLLTATEPQTSDITLTASTGPGRGDDGDGGGDGDGETFHLHKFLLAARTPYFHRKLTEAPDMATWKLSSHVPAQAFRLVMHYLYLDDVTLHTSAALAAGDGNGDGNGNSVDEEEEELLRSIDKITKQLGVEQLWEAILAGTDDRRLARQRYQDEVERAQKQVAGFFRQHVLGNKIKVDASKVDDVKWPHDNFIFADCLLYAEEPVEEEEEEEADNDDGSGSNNGGGESKEANSIPIGPAATATTTEPSLLPKGEAAARQPRKPRSAVLYPAHKALLVRADYFKIMFSSAFIEAQTSEHLRIIKVDCAPEVLELVLSFLYTEQADIPLDLALDVLYVADMLFLERLKTKAAVIISTLGNGNRDVLSDPTRPDGGGGTTEEEAAAAGNAEINIYEVLRAAWDLKVQRLEDFAARFLAQRLEHYIDNPVFAELVLESANRLKTRQATDSIELVDDIRYFLSERFRLRFEDVALSDIVDADEEAAADGAAATKADEPRGVLRTLGGELAEDEFDSDALNYKILLSKIDALLEKLGLDG